MQCQFCSEKMEEIEEAMGSSYYCVGCGHEISVSFTGSSDHSYAKDTKLDADDYRGK